MPRKWVIYKALMFIEADRTGLEPATSAVTGRHSNQLNYRSKKLFRFFRSIPPFFWMAKIRVKPFYKQNFLEKISTLNFTV